MDDGHEARQAVAVPMQREDGLACMVAHKVVKVLGGINYTERVPNFESSK